MDTTKNQTFHTRIQNILDGQNISDKDKSENIIKLMTSLTNDFATLQFKDKNEFDEFIGKNLGQEMRAVVRKISNNASLIHDDQLFQVISILSTLHTSTIANLIISYDMFNQMVRQRDNAIAEMKSQFDSMLSKFTNDVGTKIDIGSSVIQSNIELLTGQASEKQKEYMQVLIGFMGKAKQEMVNDVSKVMVELKQKLADMDSSSKEIVSDFKAQKAEMEKETLEKLNNDITTVFMEQTKQFFKNLKFWMLIGSSCLSALATAFFLHYMR
ncbi:hypothetical protein N7638_05670 [Achromobacter mucicolens]|uniref:hypothetical protein n=1 Tax=Achromobacter mucicolens TaxID=1389922 RepID=UPI002447717F|nr:hypothetical protein [Achromobacter mucicolens]MDG9967512.1 hypothetical protein [Achromobacter mucicolens]